MKFPKGKAMLSHAIETEIIPCAACAFGKGDMVFDEFFAGSRAKIPQELPLLSDTKFDMASLSKVLSTTMVALKAIEAGKLCLSDKLSDFFACSDAQADITIKHLMTHTAGFEPSLPIWRECESPKQVMDYILSKPLAYKPGEKEAYSCMGYITLGKILEKIEGKPLDVLAKEQVFAPLQMKDTAYNPQSGTFAATEYSDEEGKVLCGIVHDENARFLKGVSGNAGVFSTLCDMERFAAMLSKKGAGFLRPETFLQAVTDYTPDFAESRGLGLLLHKAGKDDFSGKHFSDGSYGHTGFTGTSLMVDKATGFYVVLLTNRVHPTRENQRLFQFRRDFHDTVISEYRQQCKEEEE